MPDVIQPLTCPYDAIFLHGHGGAMYDALNNQYRNNVQANQAATRRCKTFQIYKMQSALSKCTFYEHLRMGLQEIRGIVGLETYDFFPALF